MEHPPHQRSASGAPPASLADRLDSLESALRHALEMDADLPEAVRTDLARQVAELTRTVAAVSPEDAALCIEKLRGVRRIHDQLALRVRQEQQETVAQLAQLRKGRKTLKVYGQDV